MTLKIFSCPLKTRQSCPSNVLPLWCILYLSEAFGSTKSPPLVLFLCLYCWIMSSPTGGGSCSPLCSIPVKKILIARNRNSFEIIKIVAKKKFNSMEEIKWWPTRMYCKSLLKERKEDTTRWATQIDRLEPKVRNWDHTFYISLIPSCLLFFYSLMTSFMFPFLIPFYWLFILHKTSLPDFNKTYSILNTDKWFQKSDLSKSSLCKALLSVST